MNMTDLNLLISIFVDNFLLLQSVKMDLVTLVKVPVLVFHT